jgi:hypothetical protein
MSGQWACEVMIEGLQQMRCSMESVLFVLPRKLQLRSPPRAGDSGACRSDLRHVVASFPRHGASLHPPAVVLP